MALGWHIVTLCSALHWQSLCLAELTINFHNKGGELLQESISSNVSDDTIHLEFEQMDGTHIAQDIDFKSDIQIFSIYMLGEEELGESEYQTLCFITRFPNNEFISSDAMSKLRQKNPGTIRVAEEDRGDEELHMDVGVHIPLSSVISPHIQEICSEAQGMTFARESDLKLLSKVLDNKDLSGLMSSVFSVPGTKIYSPCKEVDNLLAPCTCQLDIVINWFPCALKFCRGKDSSGKLVSYRCGIKTCAKHRTFYFHVRQKQLCMWNDTL